jgi:hypothetical protein
VSQLFADDPLSVLTRPRLAPGAPRFPILSPEEEETVLGTIGRRALGGLGYVAGALDKPRRAVAGLLGGRPRELLNVLPFSDALGLTDETEALSGRQLLEQYGVLGPNQEGFDLGDVAGFVADVGLDPLTYATFGAGALTKAGLAAKKAGTLATTGAGRIAAGQGGLAGLRVPFTEAGVTLGTGQLAQRVAGGLDVAGDFLKYAPGVRQARALFDYKAGNTPVAEAQRVYEDTFLPTLQKATADTRGEFVQRLRDARAAGVDEPMERLIRQAGEGVGGVATNAAEQYAEQLGGDLRTELRGVLSAEQRLGIPTQEFQAVDPTGRNLNYFPRYSKPLEGEGQRGGFARRLFQSTGAANLPREEILRNLDAETINKLVRDPDVRQALAGNTPLVAQDLIRSRYLGNPAAGAANFGDLTKQAEGLAGWAGGLDPRYADIDFFRNSPLADYATRKLESARKTAAGEAIHELLARNQVSGAVAGNVSLDEVLRRAGLSYEATDQAGNLLGGRAYLAQKLGVSPGDLANRFVPPEIADSAARYMQTFSTPDAVKPLVDFVDNLTNLFKSGVTVPFPSFHVRNLVSGAFMNWLTRAFDPTVAGGALNPLAYVRPYLDAFRLSKGQAVEGLENIPLFAGRKLNADQATKEVADLMFAHGVAGPGQVGELRGALTGLPDEFLGTTLPGSAEAVPHPSLGGLVPRSGAEANPFNVRGFQGREESAFTLAREGNKAHDLVEFMNRASSFIANLKQGYAPEAAALRTKAAQFDYSQLSQFERSVMRRVVPFYTFSRKNLPFQLEQLATEPGRLATTLRAATAGDDASYVPEYLRGGASIPLGAGDREGTTRFISQLGLPFEEAFGKVEGGPNWLRQTAEKYAGSLNPLLKLPLEGLTGRQFYTGRDLDDLYTRTGSVAGDQLLMNSPLSRAYTQGRTAVEALSGSPAKALNLLTGLRITDVDVEKQQQIEGRKLLEQLLKQNPNVAQFQTFNVPKDKLANMTPQDELLMRLERTLVAHAQEAALEKRAKAGDREAALELQKVRARRGGGQ